MTVKDHLSHKHCIPYSSQCTSRESNPETHTSNPNEHKGVGTIEKQDDRDAAIRIGVCRDFVDEKQVGVWREKNIKVEAVGRLQVEVGEQQFADMVGDKKDEGLGGRYITCGLLQVKRYESNGVTFVFVKTHTSNPNEHKGVGTIEKQDDRDAAIWIGVCRDFEDEKQVGVWREKNIKVEAVGRLQVEVGEQQFADMVGDKKDEETHTSNPNEHKGVGTIEKQDDRDAAIWIGVCRGFVDEKQVGVWREKNIKVEAVGRLQVEVGEQQFADMVGDKKDEGLGGRDITCGLLQVKRYESNGVTFVFVKTHTSNPNEHKGVGTIEKQDDRDAAIWIGVCRDFEDEKQVGVWREKNIKVEAVGRLQVEVGEQQFADMVGDKKDEETHTSNPNEHKGVGTIEKQDDRDAAIWIGVCRGFVDEKQVGVWREKNIKVEAVGRLQVEVGEQQFADMVGDKKDEGLGGRDMTCGLLQVKRYESNGVTFVFVNDCEGPPITQALHTSQLSMHQPGIEPGV
ncbi:hypothetical protein LINPERPRIM_LOCUS3838 [Linum perenne]